MLAEKTGDLANHTDEATDSFSSTAQRFMLEDHMESVNNNRRPPPQLRSINLTDSNQQADSISEFHLFDDSTHHYLSPHEKL